MLGRIVPFGTLIAKRREEIRSVTHCEMSGLVGPGCEGESTSGP